MRINKIAVRAICCKAWGISPWEFDAARQSGQVTFQQIVSQVRLELTTNIFTAGEILERVLPGLDAVIRNKKHVEANATTMSILKKLKEQNGR